MIIFDRHNFELPMKISFIKFNWKYLHHGLMCLNGVFQRPYRSKMIISRQIIFFLAGVWWKLVLGFFISRLSLSFLGLFKLFFTEKVKRNFKLLHSWELTKFTCIKSQTLQHHSLNFPHSTHLTTKNFLHLLNPAHFFTS